jgi:hypothetical protein
MVAAGSLQPEEPGLEPDQRLYQNFENPWNKTEGSFKLKKSQRNRDRRFYWKLDNTGFWISPNDEL